MWSKKTKQKLPKKSKKVEKEVVEEDKVVEEEVELFSNEEQEYKGE